MKYLGPLLLLLAALLPNTAFSKVCRKGIPCGNTCIAAWKTCHVGQGTAVSASDSAITGSRDLSSPNVRARQTPSLPTLQAKSPSSRAVFRSKGVGFFVVEFKPEGTLMKCESPYCSSMIVLRPGTPLRFMDDFKLVEFSEDSGATSCEVSSCRVLNN